MTRLKDALTNNENDELRNIINHAVIAVDKENSTHINSDGVGREQLTERIMSRVHVLRETLSDIDSGLQFIEYVAAETTNVDDEHNARTNLSFASKFAHYACFYLFEENDPRRDNFSIYDNVLNKALPIYIKKYNLDDYDPTSYSSYYKCIGKIIGCTGESLSRNGFDHLVWYYYKARLDSIKIKKSQTSGTINTHNSSSSCSFTTSEIYDYILELKESARLNGRSEIALVARDIGRHFGRLDRIVMVCNAMYRAMNEGDVVVHTTASGFSTTIEIKYRLN